MVWDESAFQKTPASKPVKLAYTNAILFLENQQSGKWHAAVQEGKQLPLSRQLTLIKPANCSTVTLRLFLGHPTNEVFDVISARGSPPKKPAQTMQPVREKLTNIAFTGVTGFTQDAAGEMLCDIEVDETGTMVMSAVEKETGAQLLIGPKTQHRVTRKVFDPTYRTPK